MKGKTTDCQSKKYTRYGVPEQIAQLRDAIVAGLPAAEAMAWPERFALAIAPGADLSLVWHQWAAWLLSDSGLLTITPHNRREIATIASLHRRAAMGKVVKPAEWFSWAGAAWSLAWSSEAARVASAEVMSSGTATARATAAAMAPSSIAARVAARSAAWSWSLASARSAHELAWSSAWSSGSASAWRKMADKLVELLEAAE